METPQVARYAQVSVPKLRIVAEETGKPLPFAGVMIYVEKRRHMHHTADPDGCLRAGPLREGARVEILVRAEGRRAKLVQIAWPPASSAAPFEIALATLVRLVEDHGHAGVQFHLGRKAGSGGDDGRLVHSFRLPSNSSGSSVSA